MNYYLLKIDIPDFKMPMTPEEFIDGVDEFIAPEIQTFVFAMAAISLFRVLMFGGR